ncbi:MAG: vanadium-dependent haloperoxidase [Candidatus Paceibacterota bacterium]
MQLGRVNNSTRTADQTEIALLWADGGGTFTPPGHWNQIAADVALARGNTLAENARLFALLNIAEADAGIAAWDAKYAFDLWRPIDAIRRGDIDGHKATGVDPIAQRPLADQEK